jgi:hypothetical protein
VWILRISAGLCFYAAAAAIVSTYIRKTKFWWVSRGLKVKIVRNRAIGLLILSLITFGLSFPKEPGKPAVQAASHAPTDPELAELINELCSKFESSKPLIERYKQQGMSLEQIQEATEQEERRQGASKMQMAATRTLVENAYLFPGVPCGPWLAERVGKAVDAAMGTGQ